MWRFLYWPEDDGDAGDKDPPADISGKSVQPSSFRCGGRRRFDLRQFTEGPGVNSDVSRITEGEIENQRRDDEQQDTSSDEEPSRLPELQRRVAAELSRCRTSGLFTDLELDLIESLWIRGEALRAFGRRYGISQTRVSQLIEGIRERCSSFYHWWTYKHRARRFACRAAAQRRLDRSPSPHSRCKRQGERWTS